MINCMF